MSSCFGTVDSYAKTCVDDVVTSLAWSSFGADTQTHPHGVLIAGTQACKLTFWSPDTIENNDGYLGSKEIDVESVNCLAVNVYKPNLVVSGGSAVLLHNFARSFESPDSFTPAQEPQDRMKVVAVDWNCKIAHIFASATEDGAVTIWDVKNKKSVFKLYDPSIGLKSFNSEATDHSSTPASSQRVSLSWSPESQVQLAAACDSDTQPHVNVWDLRKPGAPLFALGGFHRQGVTAVNWSPLDSGVLLSCSRDDVIASWNTRTVFASCENVGRAVVLDGL